MKLKSKCVDVVKPLANASNRHQFASDLKKEEKARNKHTQKNTTNHIIL